MLIRRVVHRVFVILGMVIFTAFCFDYLPWWSMLVVIACWLSITVYGVLNIQSGYFLDSHSNNPSIAKKAVAITFDDGPNQHTLAVLAVLKRYDAKATFFCIGKQVVKHPSILSQIISQGHIVGNHTYSHSQLIDTYSAKKFTAEIIDADTSIAQVLGKKPLLFRPPYGITNPNIAKALMATKHQVIGWNKRSFDTTIPSEKMIVGRLTKNLQAGDVILLHDTKKNTVAVLEQLLLFLQQQQFTTITIDELFSISPYE